MLLEQPITYIKYIALSNINISLLYVKGQKEGKNGYRNNAISRQLDKWIF